MKLFSSLILILLSLNGFTQNHSDLYVYIDSLIEFELKYEYDSTTDQLPKYEWDSTKTIMHSFSTFPSNPSPLIILNKEKVDRTALNKYKLSQIATIDLYKKEDIKTFALYGVSAKNGAIIIQTKKFQRKKKKPK